MSFATSPKQQQQKHSTTSAAATISSSRITSSSLVQLPKTFTTAQNCSSNFWPEQQEKSPLGKSSLMIKNTELSANQTDWDEKEEEKEICNVVQRRDSVPEDATISTSTKLNTIEETIENNHSVSPLLARRESLSIVTADTTTSVSAEEQQQHENTTNTSIENLNSPTSSTGFVNSTNQLGGSDNSTNTTTRESDISAGTITTTTTSVTPTTKSDSPSRKSSAGLKGKISKTPSFSKLSNSLQNTSSTRGDEDTVSKSSDTSCELIRGVTTPPAASESISLDKPKVVSRLSERAKKKSWYNVLYPNYKSRSEDFKKLFKEVPNDDRLIVDYSCALQRDILVQGRLYVSQNYVCFHANIFRWETYLSIKWRDVTSITKEKTALVIPNAISISTAKEKYFFATFTSRDKSFLMLFRVWQNTLMKKQMSSQEIWQWVHNCYGDELGLTTDDEDYIDPTTVLTENDSDLDFVSALDDSGNNTSSTTTTQSIAGSEYYTATTNSNQSINQIVSISSATTTTTVTTTNTTNSSTSSVGSGIRKSKSKLYFFNSNKSANIHSSTTASASGSDNKTSDNNSGADNNIRNNKKTTPMKPNAKELTLNTAKPDENAGVAVAASTASSVATPQAVNGGTSDAKTTSGGAGTNTKETKASSSASLDGKRKVSKNTRQRDESLNKNSEALPTDMSDSSDSDEKKIPFVSTAECTSTHEGRQMVHTILPINIETLFNFLFSKSKFLVDFHAMRKSTDTIFGEWVTNEEGQRTRTFNVTVQLAASVGPKTSKVTEFQTMRDCSKPGELYSIDINSVNAGIPYADSFSVQMHNCLVRTIDDHTMLSVHAQIKYKKSIWGVVKGFIEKNTWAGLEDFYGALLHALQSETCIPPAKGKGRRPRRGTAAQIRPIEDTPIAQIKPEPHIECELRATHALAPHLLPAVSTTGQVGHGVEVVPNNRYKWLSLFVIVLLFFLIVLNVILLFKLWKLEDRIEDDLSSRARMPNLSALKQLPNTHQEWIELLRQQEILHETELRKWHTVLQTAIELLKKTEKTLAALMFR